MEIRLVLFTALGGSVVALLYALLRTKWIFKQEVENAQLRKIGGYVSEGAMAFLSREYKVLLPFVILVAAFLAIGNKGPIKLQSLSFILGALCSGLSGYIGMRSQRQQIREQLSRLRIKGLTEP